MSGPGKSHPDNSTSPRSECWWVYESKTKGRDDNLASGMRVPDKVYLPTLDRAESVLPEEPRMDEG